MSTRAWAGDQPHSHQPGDVVAGRYLLQSAVARGARGTVWLAQDGLLSRRVALKHLRADRRSGQPAALLEARAGAVVRHPNVVDVHDVLPDPVGGGSWIVMEALDGESLALAIVREGRVTVQVARDVATAVLDGLAALHAAGVLHRDVKPSNVQLCRDGRIVLVDFGVSQRGDDTASHEAPQFIAGTLPYLAPEVLSTGRSSPASDLYALGATLHHALEGTVPFEVQCVQDLVEHAMTAPPPPVARWGGPLTPLLRGLLQPRPEDRWPLVVARRYVEAFGGRGLSGTGRLPAQRVGAGGPRGRLRLVPGTGAADRTRRRGPLWPHHGRAPGGNP